MQWTRAKAEQYVVFYTGLISHGAKLTTWEKKVLSEAQQFLRSIRKGSRRNIDNPVYNYPDPRAIGARSVVGAKKGTGLDAIAQFTTEAKALEGMRRVQAMGLIAYVPYKSPTTPYWVMGISIPRRNTSKSRTNPVKLVQIYEDITQIKGTKRSGPYKGQRFYHDFKHATAYGLPNGDILLTSRKF